MDSNWLDVLQSQNQLAKVIETNQYTERFGLILSQQDAQQILDNRKTALQEQRRVEFGEGIVPKIIFEFCDSDYMNITLRRSRLSGVARATFPDKQSHLVINYCIMF